MSTQIKLTESAYTSQGNIKSGGENLTTEHADYGYSSTSKALDAYKSEVQDYVSALVRYKAFLLQDAKRLRSALRAMEDADKNSAGTYTA